MSYTVKNGTWCKDSNGQEYYSCTKAGLKAALAAGEIVANDRVIVHDRLFPVGTIIHSLATEAPEGFMSMEGQAIPTVYDELIAVVGPILPDTRECVLVGAGENTELTIAAHDVYAVGEFKDDTIQGHKHTDAGHTHTVQDQSEHRSLGSGNTNQYEWAGESGTGYANLGLPTKFNDDYGEPRVAETTHGKQFGVKMYIAF